MYVTKYAFKNKPLVLPRPKVKFTGREPFNKRLNDIIDKIGHTSLDKQIAKAQIKSVIEIITIGRNNLFKANVLNKLKTVADFFTEQYKHIPNSALSDNDIFVSLDDVKRLFGVTSNSDYLKQFINLNKMDHEKLAQYIKHNQISLKDVLDITCDILSNG